MEQKVLKVEGMSCGHCVRAVEQAVNGVTGFMNAAASLEQGTVSFGFEPAETPLEKIKSAIAEEGYTVVD